MISKSLSKYIQSLHQKKYRQELGAFLVEGAINVLELCASDYQIEVLLVTEPFYKENALLLDKQRVRLEMVSADDLKRVGSLVVNDSALAVVKTKENRFLVADPDEFVLVLDDIRDPGNLGTILRIADWYGIRKLICSLSTADVYNPKVISASKGSFTRVAWYYCDLKTYLAEQAQGPVYGAFLDGASVHSLDFGTAGYIVMGNEANGISVEVEELVSQRITIPRFGEAESLNVGIATAIICDNLRRVETSREGIK
ncbi:TrmH family RNA methyltransferase [Larkinella punicea]|uniref:RNA methyltransferase n=1 Tax=Larkinella punicea TaxID=2315727 RepID=A0A368JFL5_9BACT|nr:RNA methyltransferase [Larkinella punicea]RCR65866.1 RNA methyltransferase [Larkinella punicea]